MKTSTSQSGGFTLAELRQRPTLHVEEAGAVLGLGRTGAYAAAKRGDIPTIRVGRRRVVPTLALLRMLGDDGSPVQSAPSEQVAG